MIGTPELKQHVDNLMEDMFCNFDNPDEIKHKLHTDAQFLAFAKLHPELKFLVTEIGCGIAGFTPEDIAPLFRMAIDENIENIYLPESFLL